MQLLKQGIAAMLQIFCKQVIFIVYWACLLHYTGKLLFGKFIHTPKDCLI